MKYGIMRNGTFKKTRAKRLFFCIKKTAAIVLTKLSTSDIILIYRGKEINK